LSRESGIACGDVMERYSGTQAMEGLPVDPVAEWAAPEPMWQLGLGGGPESYPVRPDAPDCIYFMRTGFCGYGSRCRFNHPRDRNLAMGSLRTSGGDYPERMGQPVCQNYKIGVLILYYTRTGMCKFGSTCKYHHPKYGVGSSAPIMLNFSGYPSRPVPANPGASSSLQPPTVGAGQIYGITQLSSSSAAYTGPYVPITSTIDQSSSSQNVQSFPERPGQPECQYYLRTGDCKFGSTCKYHHPREWTAPTINFSPTPVGLPLRPGMPICSHYAQSGMCRYGPSCRFDHPMGTMTYSPSASSLTDIPVAPYPVGFTSAALAPSSSSLDLKPETLSGLNKDLVPSQISDVNSSSTSVGSILSKPGPAPQSGAQHSGPASASASASASSS
ncbi:zinc finger CCCH domain-containing protein 6, partial [Striga asiatica]